MDFLVLRESFVRFDGGAMFGHVPKSVWGRMIRCDKLNRVQAACNQLLVRLAGKTILTDPGMGTKWSEREMALYELRVTPWEEILSPHGLTPADIDLIVLTHLHLDHAGALTVNAPDGTFRPTFPNATVVVQRGEWQAANNPDLRSIPSYRPHDFQPIMDAGMVRLIDGDTTLLPGCELFITGGHTAYHQSIRFTDGETTILVPGDVLATSHHLKPHWAMGYDLFPLQVIRARQRLFEEATNPSVYTLFSHDADVALARLLYAEDGKLTFQPAEKEVLR